MSVAFSRISSEKVEELNDYFIVGDSKEYLKNGRPPPEDQPIYTRGNDTSPFSHSFLILF